MLDKLMESVTAEGLVTEKINFLYLSDDELLKIRINLDLSSKDEADEFLEELKNRNLLNRYNERHHA